MGAPMSLATQASLARRCGDPKDVCPGPSQSCLDDFEFVGRVGFNRSGDAVVALCVLGHLPCPPSILPA